MERVKTILLDQAYEVEYLANQHANKLDWKVDHEIQKIKYNHKVSVLQERFHRYVEDTRHYAYKEKGRMVRFLRPYHEFFQRRVYRRLSRCQRRLMHRYKLSEFHHKVLHIRRDKKNKIPVNYQMRPVIFSMDLDSKGTQKTYRELYDEVFLALTNLRHRIRPDNLYPLHFIGTADLVLLSHASLKTSAVTISENFDVFVARSADSVILVAEDISHLPDIIQETFRNIYPKTVLRYLPLLILLINPLADYHDEVWRKRIASVERIALRETLLRYGSMNMAHKIYFVRSHYVLEDVERALLWLWRKTDVRDRKKIVPLSTSTTKKRWEVEVEHRVRAKSVAGFRRGSRRHSILVDDTAALAPRETKGKRVRIDPIPSDMENPPTQVQSLMVVSADQDQAKQHRRVGRQTRSLSPRNLADVVEHHPDVLLELQEHKAVRFPNSKAGGHHNESSKTHEEHAASRLLSVSMAKALLEGEEERMLSEKFMNYEIKYLELREYQKKLVGEEKELREKVTILVERLRDANSTLIKKMKPAPAPLTDPNKEPELIFS